MVLPISLPILMYLQGTEVENPKLKPFNKIALL